MATIAKNTKKAAAVFESATRCVSCCLSNGFAGNDCDPKYAREALHNSPHAKLYSNEHGGYTVYVHSNHWYEIAESLDDVRAEQEASA